MESVPPKTEKAIVENSRPARKSRTLPEASEYQPRPYTALGEKYNIKPTSRKIDRELVKRMMLGGKTITEVADELHIARRTIVNIRTEIADSYRTL